MVTRTKSTFWCYTVAVILFFCFVGLYVNADTKGNIPAFIEWIGLPGTLIAAFCLVGVHSDHFILASILRCLSPDTLFVLESVCLLEEAASAKNLNENGSVPSNVVLSPFAGACRHAPSRFAGPQGKVSLPVASFVTLSGRDETNEV
jgi:hypothetical protein